MREKTIVMVVMVAIVFLLGLGVYTLNDKNKQTLNSLSTTEDLIGTTTHNNFEYGWEKNTYGDSQLYINGKLAKMYSNSHKKTGKISDSGGISLGYMVNSRAKSFSQKIEYYLECKGEGTSKFLIQFRDPVPKDMFGQPIWTTTVLYEDNCDSDRDKTTITSSYIGNYTWVVHQDGIEINKVNIINTMPIGGEWYFEIIAETTAVGDSSGTAVIFIENEDGEQV